MNSSPRAAAVEAPPSGLQPDLLYRDLRIAGQLSRLLLWVERARRLSDHLVFCAEHDARLAETLRNHGLPVNNCIWDVEESDAMEGLLSLQASLVRDAADALARAA